ncbi:hypothetical protein [Porphyromonas gingivicanis]|nr:hypothetical protein [Porphyromonas gingivicanis]
MMLFLDGNYIAGQIARPIDGASLHEQFILLPLSKGQHILTLKSYRRWGRQSILRLTPESSYTQYQQEVILEQPTNRLQLKEWALPAKNQNGQEGQPTSNKTKTYPKARSIGLYSISLKPLQ